MQLKENENTVSPLDSFSLGKHYQHLKDNEMASYHFCLSILQEYPGEAPFLALFEINISTKKEQLAFFYLNLGLQRYPKSDALLSIKANLLFTQKEFQAASLIYEKISPPQF